MVIVWPLVDTVGGPEGPLLAGVAVPAGALAAVEADGLVVVLVHPLIITTANSIASIERIDILL